MRYTTFVCNPTVIKLTRVKTHSSESRGQEKTGDDYREYFAHMTMSTFYSTQN